MKRMIVFLSLLLALTMLIGCGTGDLWFQSKLTVSEDGRFRVDVPQEYQRYFGVTLEFTADQLVEMDCSEIAQLGRSGDQVIVSFKVRKWFHRDAVVYSVTFAEESLKRDTDKSCVSAAYVG